MLKNKHNALFISHGGGPMPLLGDESHEEMVACLKKIAANLQKPSAIILASAHWEEKIPTITASQHPNLIYDYHGFPAEAYTIQYPCQGSPSLASSIQEVFTQAGIESKLDAERGFDHGLFVPLKIMFPEADIPCIQVSLVNHLNPNVHINLGKALRSLDLDGLLVIGSGFSFHNMRAFFSTETDETKMMNEAFERCLIETCASQSMSESTREQRLIDWKNAPAAQNCHPREEHLMPLHVCYGLAQTACSAYFELHILNKKTSMYLWQN